MTENLRRYEIWIDTEENPTVIMAELERLGKVKSLIECDDDGEHSILYEEE